MLKSTQAEKQLAAVVILAEVAPKDQAVVKALSAVLGTTASRPLRVAALDALGRIGSAGAVPALLPLLEGNDEEIRERATQALSRVGAASIGPVTRRILDAAPAARRALLEVLSRVKTVDSVKALLSLIGSAHPEAPREAAHALGELARLMTRSEVAKLRKNLEDLLKVPPAKAPAGSLSASLQVMGAIGQAGAVSGVLRLTGPKYPELVRRDALLAVSRILKGDQIPSKAVATLLPILQDGPSPVLRSTALEVLSSASLPASALDATLKLLENRDPAVRRFAARQLGVKGFGGQKTVKRLVSLLSDRDPSLRDVASESLGKLPDSATLLAQSLLGCDQVHRGWTIAHILKRHVSRLRKPAVRKLFDKAISALPADDRIWEPLLYVVRHQDPKMMYEWLMEAAEKLKKARKYAEAEACLKPLTRGDHFDSEARYALALAGVKAARSRTGAGSTDVTGNCMDLFRQLVRDPAFPLVDRLKKERAHLKTEDLYFLGFHLTEGSAGEKEIGGELLKTVAARAGSTKLGRSARRKLRSQGLGL